VNKNVYVTVVEMFMWR